MAQKDEKWEVGGEPGLWRRINIKVKFFFIYFLCIGSLVLIAFYSNNTMYRMVENTNEIMDVSFSRIILANKISQDMLMANKEEKNMILSKTPEEVAQYEQKLQELITRIEAEVNRLIREEGNRQDREFLKKFKKDLDAWIEINKEVRTLKLNWQDGQARVVSGTAGRNQFNKTFAQLSDYVQTKSNVMENQKILNQQMGQKATQTIFRVSFLGILISAILGFLVMVDISRTLRNSVDSLSKGIGELEHAANEQLSGSVQLTTTTTEIGTTIKNLLVASHQIQGNANELTKFSQKTSGECEKGSITLERSQKGVKKIKERVQLIARHMLDLGQKLKHISGVLNIINELSEQTNLLSLNATIEAAGAGESGKRFAVVADEIRKLAEKAVESTKEIRILIDDIHQTSSTTVMVTEEGIKSVDEGIIHLEDVFKNLEEIIKLVEQRKETIMEIENSTRQQTTAIAQLNSSIQNVTKTAKQAESSSNRTLKTVLQLVDTSSAIEMIIGKKK